MSKAGNLGQTLVLAMAFLIGFGSDFALSSISSMFYFAPAAAKIVNIYATDGFECVRHREERSP